jgi:Bacterial Ig domain/von Willebrand factor type D domain/RTX calcium-binding nonapeptide repeat (4 copies)
VATFYGTSKDDVLFTASGVSNDTLFGLEGNDALDATTGGGNNTLKGGDGDDELFAYTNDQLFGDAGNDTLTSDGNGSNSLFGGDGNDRLFADANDNVFGDAGDDFIFAGIGSSKLTGGTGKDRFNLTPGGIPDFPTEILDFTRSEDKVVLSSIPEIVSFQDLLRVQVGADTYLRVNAGGTIKDIGILRNIQANQLTLADFDFLKTLVNVAPDANPDKTFSLLEDAKATPLAITTPTDSDGDSLTLAVKTIPDATKSEVRRSDGSAVAVGSALTLEQLANLAVVPLPNANGSAGSFSYTVEDGKGGSDSQTVTINITPVNDAPVADPNKSLTVLEDSIPTLLNIKAPTDVDGDPLTLTVNSIPDSLKGSIRLSDGTAVANGANLTLNQLQTLVFAPGENANGNAGTFKYTVSDGQGGSTTQEIAIAITPGGKGGSSGDPHIATFDGFRYDFQAQGDYVLVKGLDSDLEVQVRQTTWAYNPATTVNTALATLVDGNRVEFYADQSFLWVNDRAINLDQGQLLELGKGSITRTAISGYGLSGDWYTVTYANGDVLNNAVFQGFLMDPSLDLVNSRQVIGLLGNNNGLTADDLALRDGTILSNPLAPESLYGEFAKSWEVKDEESLFGVHVATELMSQINNFPSQPDLNTLVQKYVFGGNDDDILIGSGITLENNGNNQIDLFMGNKGSDTFVLGDINSSYYAGSGLSDYGLITDLWSGDIIQLHGSASEYTLGISPINIANGTGIFLASDPSELVGIIQGEMPANINLHDPSIFKFV